MANSGIKALNNSPEVINAPPKIPRFGLKRGEGKWARGEGAGKNQEIDRGINTSYVNYCLP